VGQLLGVHLTAVLLDFSLMGRATPVVDVFLSCTGGVYNGDSVFVLGRKPCIPVDLSVGRLGNPQKRFVFKSALMGVFKVEMFFGVHIAPLGVSFAGLDDSELLLEDRPHAFVVEVAVLLLVLVPVFPAGDLEQAVVTWA